MDVPYCAEELMSWATSYELYGCINHMRRKRKILTHSFADFGQVLYM